MVMEVRREVMGGGKGERPPSSFFFNKRYPGEFKVYHEYKKGLCITLGRFCLGACPSSTS